MILNMVVLHLAHLPFMALRVMPPLPFIVTSLASDICRFDLHFTQYPSTIGIHLSSFKERSNTPYAL